MYKVNDKVIFRVQGLWCKVLGYIERIEGKIAHVRFAVPLSGQSHAQVLIAELLPSEDLQKQWSTKANNTEEFFDTLPKNDINKLIKELTNAKKI